MALSIKQKILLDLMVKSDKIMAEHDIKYFLFGGSTLGALRHKGFIPWDDDIDIIMDAESYYKLEEVFSNGPIDGIDLVYFHNDPNWYRSFAMLVNLEDTCYTTPVMYSDGKAIGTRVDVMMCDYVPTERLEEYRRDLMLYEEVLSDSLMIDVNVYKIKDEYLALRKREEEIGKIALEKELRQNLESYATGKDTDELVVRFWTQELRHYQKDLLYPPLYHEFEGYKLPIPAKPEEQMRLQFGNDWYIIPAQDDFMLHAFTDNYFISGNNYHEDIMKFIDREEAQEEVRKRKAVLLERAKYSQSNMFFRDNIVFQREMMRVDIKNREDEFREMIKNNSWEDIYLNMRRLIGVLSAAVNVEKEHKQLPEHIMSAWIKSCIYCGKYYEAIKMTRAFEVEEDEAYKEELGLLGRVTELADAYQDNKLDEIRKLLENFTDEEKLTIPDCILCRAKIEKDENNSSDDSVNELLKICDDYIEKISINYDIKKLKADILFEKGETDKAMPLYEEVHENTVNGLDLFDIEQRFDFEKRFERKEQDPFNLMLGIDDED
ncbi:MAG: LicD family protein [Mogibacterium sp.]|nr:LicD family protein [Mogibacterium sp.]